MASSELGETFYESNLQVQTNRCESIVDEVTELVLQQGLTGDKLDLVGDIDQEIEEMKRDTKELFNNPDRINDLNRHIRRILLDIAEDLDYKQKLYDEHNNLQDDISTLFYWFELVVKPNLGADYREVEHDYAIHECRTKRNDMEHGGSGDRIRPDVIGIGLLTWYALHEILLNWEEVQNQVIHGHLNRIEQDEDNEYGFICKLNNQEGSGAPHSLTHYEQGENGNKIPFEPEDIDSFPSVGDIIIFARDEDGDLNPSDIEIL
jgi:hypothetical protein